MWSIIVKSSAFRIIDVEISQWLFHPVKWAMVGMVPNMITCASGVPMDLGGVTFRLVMVGSVHVWRYPKYSVALLYTPLPVYPLIY